MKINYSTDTSQSLYHYAKNLVGLSESDTTSFTIQQFIRYANIYLRRAAFISWKSDGNWKFDDSNNTDLPRATATLVADQTVYTLPSKIMDVERVEVMDSEGNYIKINPITKERVDDAMTEFRETSGLPEYYELLNGTIVLYPAPSADKATLTNGLKVYLSRDISEFTTADTTKEPGFDVSCHPLIAYGAGFEYALSNNLSQWRMQMLQVGIAKYEQMLAEIHSKRNKETRTNIKPILRGSSI